LVAFFALFFFAAFFGAAFLALFFLAAFFRVPFFFAAFFAGAAGMPGIVIGNWGEGGDQDGPSSAGASAPRVGASSMRIRSFVMWQDSFRAQCLFDRSRGSLSI
jgi:hypothetical protein